MSHSSLSHTKHYLFFKCVNIVYFQSLASNFWFACDCLTDVVFLADLAIQLRTGYLEQGLMVYDSRKLAGHYLNSRSFLLDLAALTPLDLLQLRFGTNPLLRFPRFLKVTMFVLIIVPFVLTMFN